MAVKNRIIILMGEKQAREGEPITIADVARAVGVSRQVMHNLVRGDTKSYNVEVLDNLCEYFDCEPGDILYREREPQN